MLIETIKRYNAKNIIKCISIDVLRANGKNLPQIHSVPALLTLPEKHLIFGKTVFDYLLLPKTGKLMQPTNSNNIKYHDNQNASPSDSLKSSQNDSDEPLSFSMNSNSFSDSFAMIEDDNDISQNGLNDRSYSWSSLNPNEMDSLKPEINDISVETRTKKEPLDLNDLYARRALELEQTDLNINQLPLPNITR
jgi:hypothetical protein